MTYSIVFSLPASVRTLLSSSADFADVHILTGPRRTASGAKELAVQEMRAAKAGNAPFGIRRQVGSFVLRAYVESKGAGEEAIDAAREEADRILGAAVDVLDANLTLGGLALFCDVAEVAEDDQNLTTDGHTFTAHATVTFTADVNPGA